MEILTKQYGGKAFAVSYDSHEHPEAKKYAQQKLDAEIDYFKEQSRIAKLSINEYVDELYRNITSECPYCKSLDTVIRRDRINKFQSLGFINNLVNGLWHVDPYRRCNNCGNDFERRELDKELLRKQAQAKHSRALKLTSP